MTRPVLQRLNWYGDHRYVAASGYRGTYRIRCTGLGVHLLAATGHDQLPMIDLPPEGAVFTQQQWAREAAEALDRRRSTETQMGGE